MSVISISFASLNLFSVVWPYALYFYLARAFSNTLIFVALKMVLKDTVLNFRVRRSQKWKKYAIIALPDFAYWYQLPWANEDESVDLQFYCRLVT